jgi:hypothetical protein
MAYNYRDRCKRGLCVKCPASALPGRPRCQKHTAITKIAVRKFRLKVKESMEIAQDLFLDEILQATAKLLILEGSDGHSQV